MAYVLPNNGGWREREREGERIGRREREGEGEGEGKNEQQKEHLVHLRHSPLLPLLCLVVQSKQVNYCLEIVL